MLEEEGPSRRRQPLVRWARKLAWIVVPVALVGELGHHLLERLGQTLAHHFFHVLFGFGAAVVFCVFVYRDVRVNGWPTFSWRLRQSQPEPAPSPPAPR